VIAYYYQSREPGEIFSSKLWMQKTIEQTWHYYITIWHCRNSELHGHNFKESQQKAIAMKWQAAQAIFTQMEGNVTDSKARLLHSDPIGNILNWTKAHLDASLAMAEEILEQNVDQG